MYNNFFAIFFLAFLHAHVYAAVNNKTIRIKDCLLGDKQLYMLSTAVLMAQKGPKSAGSHNQKRQFQDCNACYYTLSQDAGSTTISVAYQKPAHHQLAPVPEFMNDIKDKESSVQVQSSAYQHARTICISGQVVTLPATNWHKHTLTLDTATFELLHKNIIEKQRQQAKKMSKEFLKLYHKAPHVYVSLTQFEQPQHAPENQARRAGTIFEELKGANVHVHPI